MTGRLPSQAKARDFSGLFWHVPFQNSIYKTASRLMRLLPSRSNSLLKFE
jgi:hypothetical protein